MNIKLIPTVYQELVKLSKNVEVINNKLLIKFEKSIIPKVTYVLKSIQKIKNFDEYGVEVEATFNGKSISFLNEFNYNYSLKELANELSEMDSETITFELTLYFNKLLNEYLSDFTKKENLLRICQSVAIGADFPPEQFTGFIYLTKEKGFQKINQSELLELLNSDLVDNRARVIINQYVIKYLEKQKMVDQFDKDLEKILNKK